MPPYPFSFSETERSGSVFSEYDSEGKLLAAAGLFTHQIESGGDAAAEDYEEATRTFGDWNSQREFVRTSNDHFHSSRTRTWTPSVSGEGTVDYQSTDEAFTQKFWGSFGESDTRSVQQGSTWRVPETTLTRSGQYGSGAANPLLRSSSAGDALDSGFYDAGFASWGYEGQAIHTRFDSAIAPASAQSPSAWDDSAWPEMGAGPNLLRQDGGGGSDTGQGPRNDADQILTVWARVPADVEANPGKYYSRVEYEDRITAFSGITALNWSDGGEFFWNAFSWENVSGAAKATITAPFKIVEQSVLMAADGLLYVVNGGYLPRAYSELGDALRTGQITGAQAAWEMGTFILTAGLKQQYDAASHYWNGDLSEQEYRDQVAGNLWGVYLIGRSIVTAPRAATSLASRPIPVFATVVTAKGVVAVAQVGSRTLSPALAGAFAGAGTGGLIVLMAAGNIPDGELPTSNASVRTAGRLSPRQSELDVSGLNPSHRPQVSFSNGREVPYGSRGSVRPDNFRVGEALEVKNYDLLQPSNRANLYNRIHEQYLQRISNLPKGTHLRIVIDVRGQNVPESILMRVRSNILTITRTSNVTVEFLR